MASQSKLNYPDAKNQSKNVAVTICRHMVKEYPIGFFQSNGNLKSSPYFLKKKRKKRWKDMKIQNLQQQNSTLSKTRNKN